MKCIYWNIRGFANAPSRLALQNLITKNKPDFVFLSEPWMNIDNIPTNWFSRLNLKLFAQNNRDDLLPNIWCFCNTSLKPTILQLDEQFVSLSLTNQNKHFAIAAVYASTSAYRRKQLWSKLNTLQAQYQIPWNFIGDFNTILGTHEHHGYFPQARPPMIDF